MRFRLVAGLLVFMASFLLAGTAAAAEDVPTPSDLRGCTNYPERSPGIHIQTFDATERTGGLAGLPDRLITGVQAGQRATICVGFQNRAGIPVTLEFEVENVGADAATGSPTSTSGTDAPYGAASWLDLPDPARVRLAHGELAWLEIRVDVPVDVEGGSNYASVVATPVAQRETDEDEVGARARVVPAVGVQVFMDVPVDRSRGGRIVEARSPRVIWWDGAGFGDLPVLERLRGRESAPIRFTWKNDGALTDTIGGEVVVESDVGGKDVARLELPTQVILRGSERRFEVTWSRDIPIVGRFTPTIRAQGADGKSVTRRLPPIWVIPAWWYILLALLAIALPLMWRRRSRRRYDELVARLEAAERRHEAGSDADSWDEGDDWPVSR